MLYARSPGAARRSNYGAATNARSTGCDDRWFDQTLRSGHQHRLEDLTLFAELGFKALRYPVLWERISPNRPDQGDWAWTDERLTEMRRARAWPRSPA